MGHENQASLYSHLPSQNHSLTWESNTEIEPIRENYFTQDSLIPLSNASTIADTKMDNFQWKIQDKEEPTCEILSKPLGEKKIHLIYFPFSCDLSLFCVPYVFYILIYGIN